MTVTGDTPWRETGDTTAAGLIAEFRTQGDSPLVDEAARLLAAASPYSRLMAAISFVEQKHATYRGVIPASSHNFLSLASGWDSRIGGHSWHAFASYAACVAMWKALLTDPAGAYRTCRTVRELIDVYAPPVENDSERYVRQACEVINRMPLATAAGVATGGGIITGRAPVVGRMARPANVRDEYVDKPIGLGSADYGARLGRMLVLHRVQGRARTTAGHFRNLADPHGRNALTDWGVDDDWIYDWNDPDGRGSRRSPYASGGTGGESGDGIAYVAAYGRIAINRDGEAVEIDGYFTDDVSQRTFDNLIVCLAWRADRKLGVSHEQWPKNRDGVHALYWHDEFQTEKECPGPVVKGLTTEIIAKVGERLKRFQLGEGTVPAPIVVPVPTVPPAGTTTEPTTSLPLPPGVTLADVGGWFGEVSGANGGVFAFDPTGPVSAAWLARGRKSGVWPELETVIVTASGDRLFRFRDGYVLRGTAAGKVEEVAG